jgi:ABC-type glycerol-3-phosphate transport system permease component
MTVATTTVTHARGHARLGRDVGRGLVIVLLCAGALLMAFPYYWMVVASFKTTAELFRLPPMLVPSGLYLDNFVGIFREYPFGRWFFNSCLVACFRVPLVLLTCALGGFAFAKYEFRGRGILFAILLGSMMIPFHILLIPLYIIITRLQLKDTYITLILPALASGFGVFLMKQFMMSLPDEVLDAARIDGSSEFGLFYRIALPLSRPGLATLGLLSFLGSWNDFVWPLIVLNDKAMYTLPVGLAAMKGFNIWQTPWGYTMAAAFLASAPILVVFSLMQRQLVSGLYLGAVR